MSLGSSLNADNRYLLERSLKTLVLRVRQQSDNAAALAEFLTGSEEVERVHYPGLATHPGHAIAEGQMSGFGAMLSFEPKGDAASGQRLLRRLELIKPAVSLGGVETTICAPSQTSNREMAAPARARCCPARRPHAHRKHRVIIDPRRGPTGRQPQGRRSTACRLAGARASRRRRPDPTS